MIEKMKSVCVVTQGSRRSQLLDSLRDLGIFHIAERKSADVALLERFNMLSHIMLELKDYKTENSISAVPLSDIEFEQLYNKTLSAIDEKNSLILKKNELSVDIEKLRPWGEFDSQSVIEISKAYNLHFYRIDKKSYKLLKQNENIKFIKLADVDKMDTIAVIGELDDSFNAIEFNIPLMGVVQLKSELEACEKRLEQIKEVLITAAGYLSCYSEQLLKTENSIEYSSADATINDDSSLIWISGYIPMSEFESFQNRAKANNWAWLAEDIDKDDTAVPTKIKYNKLTSLIKPVFDILGVVPGYKEYDISFWFLAFFALFFAMIIGDAGYGMIFLIGTIIFNLKSKKVTNITLLLYLLSLSTVTWGAITGTWFGLEGAMKIPVLKSLVVPAFANYPDYFSLNSSSVQNNVMKFCFSIGLIQLALACIMSIKRKFTERNLSWLADLGWLSSISALYFVVLNLVIGEKINFPVIVAFVVIGFIMVVIFGGMEPGISFSKGLKTGLGSTFTVFLNTISAFGNVMSYIRLFAVGMASLAIAQSFNDMASGFNGPLVVIGAVIMIIGHLLNIIMGFLSVVVHGVRLNLLEFSGQLGMEWSGIAYKPFRKINK